MDDIEKGIKSHLFPIVISVLGFILTFTAYNIAGTLTAIEHEMTQMKIDQRDSTKDIQYINIRLNKIEDDIDSRLNKIEKDIESIKKNLE